MSSFKKLNIKRFEKREQILTPDVLYWKQLGAPILVKEFGTIDHIDFSPVEPYNFAVTCSVRVQIYNPVTKLVVKNLSRFRESAYGAVFRNDGHLLCAGCEEKTVKLFDVSTKCLLRLFKGHEAPVHRTLFIPDKTQIASFGDDKNVKIWDIPTEKTIINYNEHNDYIRAGAVNETTPDIVLSGGYDNIIKLYDTRMKDVVLTCNHGSPVESLLMLPSGGLFLSAGGTDIKIWDLFSGGKLIGNISQHHKTITCLRLTSDHKRLLSSSLDRHVKIYDISTYKVVHTINYSNAILSLGISKNDETLVAGLVDGLVVVNRREETNTKELSKPKITSFKYVSNVHKVVPEVDLVVSQYKSEKHAKYDVHLRKFEFNRALDSVLLPYVVNKKPQVTVSLIHELLRRKALKKAYEGLDFKSIGQLLKFFIKYIPEQRFKKVLIVAVNEFIDLYEESLLTISPENQKLLINVNEIIRQEMDINIELAKLQGIINMLLNAKSINNGPPEQNNFAKTLIPSEEAEKNFVITLK